MADRIFTRTPHALKMLVTLPLLCLVGACIFAPGKFLSRLDIHTDGTFAFAYRGEILMLPLMKSAEQQQFLPDACRDEESGELRECSAEELAEQKTTWEGAQERKRQQEAQAAQILLGGIDPSDPQAGHELASKLARQKGWNKVEYLGSGKFDVDFTISGKLDHDFAFPTMEGFAMANTFLQLSLRSDGNVRVDAPGFGPAGTGPAAGMLSGLAGAENGDRSPNPMADGTFTLVTDASILANNTDEGPAQAAEGQMLKWRVNPRTSAAPTALLQLAR